MPSREPTYPPASTVTQPRVLNRWLDVNPQGGALGRTHTYITVPAFEIDSYWLGYSYIIGEYKVASPNNISLIGLSSVLPTSPNYLLCVSYVNSDNTIVRYKLWEDIGEVIYFSIPLYTGQLLKKNFKFEIWSTEDTPMVQTTALTFYTSVRGNVDYMNGSDSALASPDTLCEGQATSEDEVTSTYPTDNILYHFDPLLNVTAPGAYVSSWVDVQQYAINLFQNTGAAQPEYNSGVISFSSDAFGIYTTPLSTACHVTYMIIKFNSHVNGARIFTYGSAARGNFKQGTTSGELVWEFDGHTLTSAAMALDTWYLIELKGFSSPLAMNIFDLWSGTLLDSQTLATGTLQTISSITLGNGGSASAIMDVQDIMGYQYPQDAADRLLTLQYLLNKYKNDPYMNLPLTFGACSQPTVNS